MDCSICLEKINNENMVMCTTQTHNHGLCQCCYNDWSIACTENHTNITCPICHILIQEYISTENDTKDMFEEEEIYYPTYENNIFTEYYDAEKSQKAFEVTKINGKFQGIATTYWSNGNIMRISNFVNNIDNGTLKEYNENGTLYSIQYILNGFLHGSRKIFDTDGNVNKVEHYIQGVFANSNYLNEIKKIQKK